MTGATGFVGSHLARRLVNDACKVHVILRPSSKTNILKNLENKITIHIHDETTEKMISIVKKVKPDIVFHLASFSQYKHKSEDITQLVMSNILVGNQLVEAMVRNGVKYLINTGTYWQHFRNENYNPICLYAATKKAFEDILQFYIETTDLRIITLKLFDTYGPMDPRPKIFSQLNDAIKKGKCLNMTLGDQLIDIVHVDDVVEAYLIAANRILADNGFKYQEYAISSGQQIPLKDLVETYLSTLRKDVNINWGGREYRDREVMKPWTKGKKLPGWTPKISLEDGICLT